MEERLGFIHDKLEIKILILFILRRLPAPVHFDKLAELSLCDDGISFFDFAECLADLVKTGHVTEKDSRYLITELGSKNGGITESNLPYSVRMKAERLSADAAAVLERSSLINSSHYLQRRGGCTVELHMSDGVGSLAELKLLVGSEEQAVKIEKNFQENAEKLYTTIVELLLGGE